MPWHKRGSAGPGANPTSTGTQMKLPKSMVNWGLRLVFMGGDLLILRFKQLCAIIRWI